MNDYDNTAHKFDKKDYAIALENYKKTDDIKLKNFLLKSVIDEIIYFKEKNKRNAKFELDIKLKI